MIEVGNRVRIKSDSEKKDWAYDGYMKKYCDTIGEVSSIDNGFPPFKINTFDGEIWCFNEEDLEVME